MEQITEKTIDIDQILKSKMGAKAKWVPRPIVTWLKHIAHQDQVNGFLWDARDKTGTEWLEDCVKYLQMTLVIKGKENLPPKDDGKLYTIVSNHPLGGEDGVALGKLICHKYDSQMYYLVNDLLMNLKGLAPLCIPINKTGAQSRNFPQMVESAFQSEKNVLMFPAGLCSRKRDDGTIHDLPWKKTFITKSVQYHRDVIPVHFSGQNSERFYNIARWCKRLNLKFNVAMLFLVDEMYKNVGKHFTVTFGQPIPWQTFTDKSKTPAQWAQWVQDRVYEL